MFPDKIYTIKLKNKNFGFNFKDQSYVVGFNNKLLANHCKNIVSPVSLVDINIKKQITSCSDIADMKINIQKCIMNDIEEINISNFLTYPISNNVGIVIGMDIINENESDIIIESMLIEPFDNPRYFSPE
jgi:hypothetical protein